MRRILLAGLALLAVAAAVVLLWPSAGPAPEPGATSPASKDRTRSGSVAAPAPAPAPTHPLVPGRLSGRVLGPAGSPAEGAEVDALWGGSMVSTTRSAADGTFSLIAVSATELTLVARKGALASPELGPVPLAPGEEVSGLELTLAGAGSIRGTVVDAATREPIAGAQVGASGATAVTDPGGRFALFALPPGVVVLRAESAGYEPREQPFTVGDRQISGVEVPLSRGGRISGKVISAAGAPVAGAAVWAVPYRLERGPQDRAGAVTDADGAFDVSTPAGQVQVEAMGPGGDTGKSDPIDLPPGGSREGVVVQLAPAATVAGRVLDGSGAPAAGAEVRIVAGDGAPLALGVSDGNGAFLFSGLTAGPVTAVAALGDARGSTGPVSAAQGETVQLEVRLGTGSIAGVVVDDRGRGLAGASVSAWPEGTPRTLAAATVSDARGAFTLGGLPEALLHVSAAAGGVTGELRGIRTGKRDMRLVVAGGQLTGIVLRDGHPATDFTLAVSPAKPGAPGASTGRVLSPDGRFRMTLPPGAYEVKASARGAIAAAVTAEVPSRGSSSEVRIDLVDGAVIRGTVLDARTSAPIAGVRVSVSWSGTSSFAQATDFPGVIHSVTASDGTFALAGVPIGRVPVFADRTGYGRGPPQVVQTSAGAPASVEIRLQRADQDPSQTFGGVGMTLQASQSGIIAADVLPGGPSWAAGVRRGDLVLSVDGASLEGMNLQQVVDVVRGEVGAPVVLQIRRGDVFFEAVCVRAELRF